MFVDDNMAVATDLNHNDMKIPVSTKRKFRGSRTFSAEFADFYKECTARHARTSLADLDISPKGSTAIHFIIVTKIDDTFRTHLSKF